MMRTMAQEKSKPVVTFKTTPIDSNATNTPTATASGSKAASKSKASKQSKPIKASSKSKTTAAKRASQQGADTEKTSNRKRRLASLFMSFLASSPMALENATDAETIEAAKKASIAPKVHTKTHPSKSHKRKVSVIRTVEIRPSRWKQIQYGMKLKPKEKTNKKGGWTQFEMDDMQALKI